MCICVFGNFYPVYSLISYPANLPRSITENESFDFVLSFCVWFGLVWLIDCVVLLLLLLVGWFVLCFLSTEKLILCCWLVGYCGFLLFLVWGVCGFVLCYFRLFAVSG